MKKCPFCAEDVQDEARKCRYCGSFFRKSAPCNEAQEPKKIKWSYLEEPAKEEIKVRGVGFLPPPTPIPKGSYSTEQLKLLYSEGKIDKNTKVCADITNKWEKLKDSLIFGYVENKLDISAVEHYFKELNEADKFATIEEESIVILMQKYLGENIQINFKDPKRYETARLISVGHDFFSTQRSNEPDVFHFPIRQVLKMVESENSLSIEVLHMIVYSGMIGMSMPLGNITGAISDLME